MAANNAVGGVMDDSSLDDANTARDTAEAQEGIAMGHMTTAMTKQTEAEGAEMKAMMYADDHVIGLLQHANAQDLELGDAADVDLADALARAKAARLEAVSGAINSAAGGTPAVDTDNDSSTADGTSTSTATASWLGRALDDPDADDDESTMPTLSITVSTTSDGTDLTFRTEASEDDPDTPNDESMTEPKTATMLDRGLGDFGHGY